MNASILMLAVVSALSLSACDKPTTVVNVPEPAAIPGPPGPAGATGNQGNDGMQGATGNQGNDGLKGNTGNQGNQGNDGAKGNTGNPGDGTTVIVVPPSSAPSN